MRATLQTIADAVGVSRSTVSNAYGRPDQLSPELRERILATATELGYPGPHPTARSLRRGRVDAIGVLFTARLSMAFSDPFAVAYLRGLAEVAERRDTSLLLIPVPYVEDDAALRAVRNAAVDAFCVYGVPDWHRAWDLVRARGLPLAGGGDPARLGPDACYVGIDERAAARRLGAHVAGLGHRHVAIVGEWVTETSHTHVVTGTTPDRLRFYTTGERVRGFADALAAAGIAWPDVTLVNAADNDRASGAAATELVDRLAGGATAILATSDVLALGVLDGLAARGLRPGRDVSVTGFDDIPEAAAAGLTTIRQPGVEQGRLVGELLLVGADSATARHRLLPTTLEVRASTGPAPRKARP